MSVSHWMCEGVGINVNDIIGRLDRKKCIAFLKTQLPDEEFDEETFDIDDYLYGEPYDNLGEILCGCDDTGTMDYGDSGEGGNKFFYYVPSYPWQRKKDEPNSIEEVHQIIINAVQKICLMPSDEIEEIIDDNIYEEGWG